MSERLELINHELRNIVFGFLPKPALKETPVKGLSFSHRGDDAGAQGCSMYNHGLTFIVGGTKRSIVGSREYIYGKNHCLLVGVDVPASYCTINATRDDPFLAISVSIDRSVLSELVAQMVEPDSVANDKSDEEGALCVGEVSEDTWEAVLRLCRLIDKPQEADVLAPMIIREIYFRVLQSSLGRHLWRFNARQAVGAQISTAIRWLRENYTEPLSVKNLAEQVHMGVSTFHRHFKDVTCMTPLQYHKRLRLHEAKRLMLSENMDASTACYAVGYESPSQFNREYKRQFGNPPHRDVKAQRASGTEF